MIKKPMIQKTTLSEQHESPPLAIEKAWESVVQAIGQNDTFIVCTHVNPDPDALASQLAMTRFLRQLGKKVYPLVPEEIPSRFSFLPDAALLKVPTAKQKINYDVLIVVDCGDFERIGEIQSFLQPKKVILNIDHHVTNSRFGTTNLVIPEASSTSEVIYDLFKRMDFELDNENANLLYIGIMTDTGSFRYDNTTRHTHFVVSELLKFPVPVAWSYRRIYESIPASDVKNFNRLVNSVEFLMKNKVVCLELTQKQVKSFSAEFDLRDKIFRYVRAIKGVEVIMICTEEKKNKTRVNLRSQGKVDVSRLAYHFHGGGHSQASGCMIDADVKNARKLMLAEVRKVIT